MATPKVPKIPSLIYGTAWKKDHTRALVKQALLAGFRGVDTAAQPKHYQEDLVGQGIRDAINEGAVKREDLYIQTKFTSIQGQDPRKMPYNPESKIADQVSTSIKSSLHNLRHTDEENTTSTSSYIDCLVLHSPLPSMSQTLEAWRTMERHVPQSVHTLGISNVYQLEVLQALYESAHVKPAVVQNRFFANSGYDAEIRAFCREKGMVYQSFWTLTANPELVASRTVAELAENAGVSKAVGLYGLVLGLGGTSVLCGTTNPQRMKDDLIGVEKVKEWTVTAPTAWKEIQDSFQKLITVRR